MLFRSYVIIPPLIQSTSPSLARQPRAPRLASPRTPVVRLTPPISHYPALSDSTRILGASISVSSVRRWCVSLFLCYCFHCHCNVHIATMSPYSIFDLIRCFVLDGFVDSHNFPRFSDSRSFVSLGFPGPIFMWLHPGLRLYFC